MEDTPVPGVAYYSVSELIRVSTEDAATVAQDPTLEVKGRLPSTGRAQKVTVNVVAEGTTCVYTNDAQPQQHATDNPWIFVDDRGGSEAFEDAPSSSSSGDQQKQTCSFLAVSCSNDNLILRRQVNNEQPTVRTLSWFERYHERVVSMDFSPGLEFLVCATSTASLFLVPIKTLFDAHSGEGRAKALDPVFLRSYTKQQDALGPEFDAELPSLAAMWSSPRPELPAHTELDPLGVKDIASDESDADDIALSKIPDFLGTTDRITEIKSAAGTADDATAISACIWWRSFTGEDFVITGTYNGVLTFLDLKTSVTRHVDLKGNPVMKLELIVHDDPPPFPQTNSNPNASTRANSDLFSFIHNDPSRVKKTAWTRSKSSMARSSSGLSDFISTSSPTTHSPRMFNDSASLESSPQEGKGGGQQPHKTQWKALLVHTLSGLVFVMVLEYREDRIKRNTRMTTYHSYFHKPTDNKFALVQIDRFHKSCQIGIQHLNKHPCISVFHPQDSTVELYELGELGSGKPFLKFRTVGFARLHRVTADFIFCIGRVHKKTHMQVISLHQARASLNHVGGPMADTVLNAPKSTVQTLQLDKMFGMVEPRARDSFMFWTSTSVYECHWNTNVAQDIAATDPAATGISYDDLISKVPVSEPIAPYFKVCADAAFDKGDHTQAVQLYKRFFVLPDQLCDSTLTKFIRIKKSWLALHVVSDVLASDHIMAALPEDLRTRLCNRIMDAYIDTATMKLRQLSGPTLKHADTKALGLVKDVLDVNADFREFIKRNEFYDSSYVIDRLLNATELKIALNYALRVAHERGVMQGCLMRIAERGLHILTGSDVGYLFNRGYAPLLLRTDYGGHIFRALPTWQQMEVIMLEMAPSQSPTQLVKTDSALTHAQIDAIMRIIPELDEKRLTQLVKFVDPGIFRRGIIWAQDQSRSKLQIVELFITALLRICYLVKQQDKFLGGKYALVDDTVEQTKPLLAAYNQEVLELSLRKFKGVYRAATLIATSLDWQNLAAASLLYELSGSHSDAVETRLILAGQQLKRLQADTAEDVEPYAVQVLALIQDTEGIGKIQSVEERARLLSMLLRFWHHHFSAHVLLLEKGLISSMKDLYDALAIVLFDGEAVNDDDQEHHTTFVNSSGGNEDSTFKNRWPHLSVQVYLACSREKLEKSATHPSVTMLGKLGDIGRGGMMSGRMLKASSSAAINRLWSEIIANLDKDMNEHTNCSFNCVYRLPSASTARLRPQTTPLSTVEAKVVADEVAKNASKAVAFTCGHVYQHTYFYTELVPELMARLEKLHPRIPSTAKLVEIEYGKRVIGLACPPCLLASLLQEQHRLHRTLSAKKQSLLIPPQNKRYATT